MSILRSNVFLEWAKNSYGSHRQWNQYWEDYYESDPMLSKLRITMELVFGSAKRVFISTSKITTTSSNSGQVYKYLPYMESSPELSSQYEIGTGGASQRSFSMTIAGRILGDPITLLNQNYMLAGFVEISFQFDGGDYDQRLVILQGDMDSITFGNKNEFLEFDINDIDRSFSEIIPKYFVTKEKFPFCGDDVIGMRYPLIFDRHFAVPCIRLEEGEFGPLFMVCQTHRFEVVTVYVDGLAYASASSYPYEIQYLIDDDGVAYTAINFGYVNGFEFDSGKSVYAEIIEKDNNYRGIVDVVHTVLEDYSQFGSTNLDEVLFAKSRAKIASIELQTLINGSDSDNATRAVDFVEQTICDQLPMMSMAYTERGYAPIVTDRNYEPVGTYNNNSFPIIDRITGLSEISKKDLFSSFTIKYYYNPLTDSYEKIIRLDSSNNEDCRKAEFQIGVREHEIIESVYIYNDESANAIVAWLASHKTRPCYYVEYSAYKIVYFRLNLGDNIKFSDEKLGISSYTATVVKKSLSDDTCTLGLKIWT